MLQESRKFAMGGNVVDMAVGSIIGDAFGTIVRSRVDDGLMLPIGLLPGSRLPGNLHHLRGCTTLPDLYDIRAARQTSPRLSSP